MKAWIRAEYGSMRRACSAVSALLLAACMHGPVADQEVIPEVGAPYAGLTVGQDGEEGALVLDVVAGPAALAGLLPADRIVSVSGEPVSASRFVQILESSRPGQKLLLGLLRQGKTRPVEFVVGDLEKWASPSGYPSRVAASQAFARTEPQWIDAIDARIDTLAPQLAPVKARLETMLRDVGAHELGYNRLPLNRQVMADPGVLIGLDRRLSSALAPGVPATALAPQLCELLALACPSRPVPVAGIQSLAAWSAQIASVRAKVRAAVAIDRAQAFAGIKTLLQTTAAHRTLVDRPNALAAIQAMRHSLRIDSAELLGAFELLLASAMTAPEVTIGKERRIPTALAAMVDGEILDFAELEGGYVVAGGPGANTYRMGRLYAVIEFGGDDRYLWPDELPLEAQTVVDLAGNDRYEASAGGPGGGWLGVAVLLDKSGDDRYSAVLGGCGAGVYGFGMLFDAAGNDIYRCDAWSSGSGIYGAGMLLDAGSGADAHHSQSLSQGVGGPAGAGLLIDEGGEDLYRANGTDQSAYGTPAVYMSFSQGVGFGIRPYDHGGFGALLDFGGNDRYEGGEFSQGGGYYYGVGLLHDASGDDIYYGSRYAQGFGCHQAAGLLTDLGGDDVYWAMTAVAQGAAWDQSVGMLFDGAGDDTYRAEALAQGAAAQQSRAWLHDAGGDDAYLSRLQSAQGAAAANTYHYRPDDAIFSFGILFDALGEDRYSSGLANGSFRVRFDPQAPEGEGNAGLALDGQIE